MTFDTENEVREYYIKYAKAKGFGVTRRISHSDDNGQVKYLTLCCSRYGKTQSNSRNMLKPNPTAGIGCEAKIYVTRGPDGKLHLSKAILDHNHALSPHKSRLFRCNKKLNFHVKRRLELNDRAGIRVNKNFNSFVVAADGHENLTFDEKTCRNFLEITRRLKLGSGDAEAVRDYFIKMQSDNPNFFSVMDVDDESRLRNAFWADARSRAVYESFHDVITFDTTYLVNKYDMPFACFVGVNHHGQSVLLGCALLSNEDTPTFVWLFNEEEFEVKCSCRRFEFRGILCRHVLCVLTHMKIKEVPPQYIVDRWKKNVKRKHNFIRCTYGGMEDTPVAKRFDRLCNSFYPVAELGSMSDNSCNSLIEKLHTLKVEYSSSSNSENDKEQAHSMNLNKKRSNNKRKQSDANILEQDLMEHAGSFDFGIATGNINPTPAAAIPYEGSSSMVMPPILGEYTSMMFQVQQASTVLSSPAELRFNGIGGLNNTTDQI
ncbi:protein FAR1-RELATED SEQUENCE 4-like [Hordeum vulgare subsp. vulgare]|uniref:protein FAR1-RELATED SEQUENCE 4-like n=1 Tax=Hordeum vulgare subsp. vulgare TaxID=112509 RepID=UPI001D1A4FF0|nr:protein FAR1-RELATED SEQUENCE 4-like [Hordeum vulgare subsp. vulgare]XP_044946345.1 protein FAR1-RELATED SEQUENCE 4-like [Hordeum vulgare subsp. vulgare]